jgi:hypothetical protein
MSDERLGDYTRPHIASATLGQEEKYILFHRRPYRLAKRSDVAEGVAGGD